MLLPFFIFSFFPCLLSANPFLCFILAFTFFFSQVILLFCILSTPRFVLEILLSRTSSLFPFLLHFVLLSDGAAVSYRNTWYLHFLPNPTKPNCGNQSLIPFFAIQQNVHSTCYCLSEEYFFGKLFYMSIAELTGPHQKHFDYM